MGGRARDGGASRVHVPVPLFLRRAVLPSRLAGFSRSLVVARSGSVAAAGSSTPPARPPAPAVLLGRTASTTTVSNGSWSCLPGASASLPLDAAAGGGPVGARAARPALRMWVGSPERNRQCSAEGLISFHVACRARV